MLPDPATLARRDARRMVQVFRELGDHHLDVGGGHAALERPGSWIDMAVGLGLDGPVTDDDVDALLAFFDAHDQPTKVQLTPYQDPSVRALLSRRGFVLDDVIHVLVHDLHDLGAGPEVPGLTVHTVDARSDADVDTFVQANLAGFEVAEPEPLHALTVKVARHPRCRIECIAQHGQVVGSGGLEFFEGSAVLIAGAVLPAARRQGIHRAYMNHRLRCARDAGAHYALVGSDPGAPTERNALRLGFRPAFTLFELARHVADRPDRG